MSFKPFECNGVVSSGLCDIVVHNILYHFFLQILNVSSIVGVIKQHDAFNKENHLSLSSFLGVCLRRSVQWHAPHLKCRHSE